MASASNCLLRTVISRSSALSRLTSLGSRHTRAPLILWLDKCGFLGSPVRRVDPIAQGEAATVNPARETLLRPPLDDQAVARNAVERVRLARRNRVGGVEPAVDRGPD